MRTLRESCLRPMGRVTAKGLRNMLKVSLKPLALNLIFLLLVTTGCAKTARYSPEELKGFPPEIQERIKSGEVVIGMTTQQVRYAWGSPSAINVLPPTEDGRMKEEWIYSKIGLFLEKRLLFIDGKLVDIFPAPKPSGK